MIRFKAVAILFLIAGAATGAEELSEPGLSVSRPAKHQSKECSTVQIKQVDISAEIDGLTARSTFKTVFENQTGDDLEGVWTFPMPEKAAVDRFAMTVLNPAISTTLSEGTLLFTETAESTFKKITERRGSYVFNCAEDYEGTYHFRPSGHASGFGGNDPGIVEKLDNGLYRLSMFPIEKRTTKTSVLSALQPLSLQDSGDARRIVYSIPLGPIKGHLATGSAIHLSARIHGLPEGATVVSSFKADVERSAGDAILSTNLHWCDLTSDSWEIVVDRVATRLLSSECIVQAHRPEREIPGVFALTILPRDIPGASINDAEIRVQLANGKSVELSGAATREIRKGISTQVYGLFDSPGATTVTLHGTVNGNTYEKIWRIQLPEIATDNAAIAKFYAAARSCELIAQDKRYDAALLSGRCHIVGKGTAFLILDGEKRYRKFHIAHGKDETGDLHSKLERGEAVLESPDDFAISLIK